jgi:DNA modification methylase
MLSLATSPLELLDNLRTKYPEKLVEKHRYSLFSGDGIAMLRDLPDKSIDLIIIDPPYEMNMGSWDAKWKAEQWEDLCLDSWRVLKPGGRLIVFGVRNFMYDVMRAACEANAHIGMDVKPWFHGDRFSMNQRNPQYMYAYEEMIIVFHQKSHKKYFLSHVQGISRSDEAFGDRIGVTW